MFPLATWLLPAGAMSQCTCSHTHTFLATPNTKLSRLRALSSLRHAHASLGTNRTFALLTYSFPPSSESDDAISKAILRIAWPNLRAIANHSRAHLHIMQCHRPLVAPTWAEDLPTRAEVWPCPQNTITSPCWVTRMEQVRLAMLHESARRGYDDIIFVETDMLWLANPLQLFNGVLFGRGISEFGEALTADAHECDLAFLYRTSSVPARHQSAIRLNSGVMYLRNTPSLRAKWAEVINATATLTQARCRGGLNQNALESIFAKPTFGDVLEVQVPPPSIDANTMIPAQSDPTNLRVCAGHYEANIIHPLMSSLVENMTNPRRIPCVTDMLGQRLDWCQTVAKSKLQRTSLTFECANGNIMRRPPSLLHFKGLHTQPKLIDIFRGISGCVDDAIATAEHI